MHGKQSWDLEKRIFWGRLYKVESGNYVLFEIKDTGIGMDNKTLKRVFEPFFTTKGFAKGTGLGLASVYGILKAHAGYIDVDSKIGHGTVRYDYA